MGIECGSRRAGDIAWAALAAWREVDSATRMEIAGCLSRGPRLPEVMDVGAGDFEHRGAATR